MLHLLHPLVPPASMPAVFHADCITALQCHTYVTVQQASVAT